MLRFDSEAGAGPNDGEGRREDREQKPPCAGARAVPHHPVVLLLAHVIVLLHERRRLRIMNLCLYEQRVRTTGTQILNSRSKLCSVQRFRFTQPEPRGKHVTRVHTAVTAYVLLSFLGGKGYKWGRRARARSA